MLQFITILILFTGLCAPSDAFKEQQLQYARVKNAYAEKEEQVKSLLQEHALAMDRLNIYLRAFKNEKKIELWGKHKEDEKFRLIKVFKVCRTSGKLGPKRQQGDRQIPEGYYHIDRFNPWSNYHLSLGINYPNKSDRILGVQGNLGGDIFIHGACVTIGCLPITDDLIKELYVFCVEAKNNGQTNIPVTIFPAEMDAANYKALKVKYAGDTDKLTLWKALKEGYEHFNEQQTLPVIRFLADGRYEVKGG